MPTIMKQIEDAQELLKKLTSKRNEHLDAGRPYKVNFYNAQIIAAEKRIHALWTTRHFESCKI